jgi:hypothetical protein
MVLMRVLGLRVVGLVVLCAAVGGLWLAVAPAGAVPLPDGRVYEAVSPLGTGQEAEVYGPEASVGDIGGAYDEHGIWAARPFEVAGDGEAVVYAGEPPSVGGDPGYGFSQGNEFLARRSAAGGWTSTDLQIPGGRLEYKAFSSELSVGIFQKEEGTAEGVGVLFSHPTASGSGDEDSPLYEDGERPSGLLELYAGANSGTSTVSAASHLLFESASEVLAQHRLKQFLYDSVGGHSYPVNVLPGGELEPNARFGSTESVKEPGVLESNFSHVISADGTRIFWTAAEPIENEGGTVTGERPKAIYVREDDTSPDARTVQVDGAVGGGGLYWTASADGSKVFFTKGDLYEYDVESGLTTDLTPGVEVQGVLGASEDGEYIYYVDSAYRLYVWHGGASTFIATLSPQDGKGVDPFGENAGAWQQSLGSRTSEVTPDGHSLVFMSIQSLTGYDNERTTVNSEGEEREHLLDEVFDYEVGTGKLTCVSCNPSGEPPGPIEMEAQRPTRPKVFGGLIPMSGEAEYVYQPRVISDDGSRVFFDSAEPLVPQDTNGWLDVYEWERDGSGSCEEAQGCIYLLSGGTDPENSYLIGAGSSGNDVFVLSRAQFVAQDRGDEDVLYDVRADGVQPAAVPSCSGSGCQGVPPAPPIFATPSSVTFEGVGNFSTPPTGGTKAKPEAKSLTAAQKLSRALKACRVMRSKRKRAVCEAGARKRYAPKSKAHKSKAKSNGRGK